MGSLSNRARRPLDRFFGLDRLSTFIGLCSLNWIDESKDLDMHFWYPNITPYHIFYDRTSSPSYSNCMSAILRNDLQDNQEVIDFDFRKMHFEDGKYQVHIQNQTKVGTFKEINAGLRIETSDGVLKIVIPPSD